MKIVIPGVPIPKARARVTKRGITYDPQQKEKERVSKFLLKAVSDYYENPGNRIEGHKLSIGEAFRVDWHFYLPIPKSFNQCKKNACKWGLIEHVSKPDRSNLEKFYEDCANGILWRDDSQIVTGIITKRYCENDNPRTEVTIMPIEKQKQNIHDIISLFSPEEISSIAHDACVLCQTTNLTNIAIFLSKLSDLSSRLSQIKKKHPEFWKSIESKQEMIQN